jgi:hypothetical protein
MCQQGKKGARVSTSFCSRIISSLGIQLTFGLKSVVGEWEAVFGNDWPSTFQIDQLFLKTRLWLIRAGVNGQLRID